MTTKNIFLGILATGFTAISSCSGDTDTTLAPHNVSYFTENFSDNTDGDEFNKAGWTNFAEIGTRKWTEQVFSDNGYAEFSSFGSSQLVNVGWLISPPIDMDLHDGEKMQFTTAQNFLRSRENSLELLVSTNFDGTNVTAADWINIPIKTATPETDRFKRISSGEVDLSKFSGKLHFAFRVKGSGTNSNLTGTYQVDNINIYYASKIR